MKFARFGLSFIFLRFAHVGLSFIFSVFWSKSKQVGLSSIFIIFWSTTIFALPNPAAVNCSEKGFTYALIQNTGFCIFRDNSYCEEWAFFRNECQAGQNQFPGGQFDSQNPGQYCVMGNQLNFCK
jgi:hypothetical protein